ncbi:MAG: FMN-binding negative transcriptional regulator, partial [Pirellula sp.]
LNAEHIPLILDPSLSAPIRMMGHVARGNELWRIRPDEEVLVIFQGPSLYISPNWYATKTDGGKVVPTWNYVVVHATCKLRATQDPDRLLEIVTRMTHHMESAQRDPWRVTDAPATYIDRMLSGIVGLELEVLRWQGKWKVSQNQPEANQHSLANRLLSDGSDLAKEMANVISRFGSASQE